MNILPLALHGALLGFLGPVGDIFNLLITQPMEAMLRFLAMNFALGNLGIAIIVFTLIIKTVLSPLTFIGARLQRKNQEEQARVGPALQQLRKKYRRDPQRLNSETMKLYQEHGINPLGQLSGCMPLLVQMPVLYGLYFSLRDALTKFHGTHFDFLWVHSLASHGVAASGETFWFVLPVFCAVTTWVQLRMSQLPGSTAGNEQATQMMRTMQFLSPAMIGYFAVQFPAGLALYWLVSNLFGIVQQWFITGWGTLPVPNSFTDFLPPAVRKRKKPRQGEVG
jgi:YidC/Oxa1 family membrane protein insertase